MYLGGTADSWRLAHTYEDGSDEIRQRRADDDDDDDGEDKEEEDDEV